MTSPTRGRMNRRDLMSGALVAGASASALTQARRTLAAPPGLEAGEGVVDTTPPMKAELGGFHRPPGQERRVEGIRHKTAARAGPAGRPGAGGDRVAGHRRGVGRVLREGGPPRGGSHGDPRRECPHLATHTHSMPGFQPLASGARSLWITWRRLRRRSSRP